MKYSLTSVIPVMSYGNIQPTIEVEADTFEEAQAIVAPQMDALWRQYSPTPLSKPTGDRKLLKAFAGGSVYYDATNHVYTNEAGDVYMSGSTYAKQFEKPFDGAKITEAMGKKYGVAPADIAAMWKLKGEVSAGFGTAIHAALELYGRYDGLAKSLERDTNLHDHPVIKKAVEGFYTGRESEIAEYEALVVNHSDKQAGRIDRLLIVDPKKMVCRVQDYKTNAVLDPAKLKVYWEQLGFYAGILQVNGWIVEGLDIFWWNGEWKTISKEL